MSEAEATGDEETTGTGGEAAPDELRRQLTQAVAERNQLAQLLKHEAESARLVIEARDAALGRVAELEGIVTGSEAVRARGHRAHRRSRAAARRPAGVH